MTGGFAARFGRGQFRTAAEESLTGLPDPRFRRFSPIHSGPRDTAAWCRSPPWNVRTSKRRCCAATRCHPTMPLRIRQCTFAVVRSLAARRACGHECAVARIDPLSKFDVPLQRAAAVGQHGHDPLERLCDLDHGRVFRGRSDCPVIDFIPMVSRGPGVGSRRGATATPQGVLHRRPHHSRRLPAWAESQCGPRGSAAAVC
jgi:hypothetical protein